MDTVRRQEIRDRCLQSEFGVDSEFRLTVMDRTYHHYHDHAIGTVQLHDLNEDS